MLAFFLISGQQAATQSLPQVERFCYLMAAASIVYEFVFNVPAIVLCRYLYLIAVRKPSLTRRGAAPSVGGC
jgi:hypothetical protein